MKRLINIVSIWILSMVTVFANIPEGLSRSFTLADRKLEGILESQNTLLAQLQVNPAHYTDSERDRRFDSLFREYEAFILDNPDNIYAYILYGKLLRQAGLMEEAHDIFMRANRKNPRISVIKQQIGNYFAEKGEYALALPCFISAIDLEPSIAVYHYQLGELLYRYKKSFINSGISTADKLDNQMLSAFHKAGQLDPTSWSYQVRYVEAFYDIDSPRWNEALALWRNLEEVAPNNWEKEMTYLNQARILIKIKKYEQAKKCLANVYFPNLEKSRRELLQLIPGLDN